MQSQPPNPHAKAPEIALGDLPPALQKSIHETVRGRTIKRIRRAEGSGSPDGVLCYKVITLDAQGRQSAFVVMPDGRYDHRVDQKLSPAELPEPVRTALKHSAGIAVMEKCDRVHFPAKNWSYYRVKFNGSTVRFAVDGQPLLQPGLE